MKKEEDVLAELIEKRKKCAFFSDGRILSSVYSKPTDISLKAFSIFHDVNALDTYLFPEIEAMEKEVIEWLSKLYKAKRGDGYITSGGTESNIVALWVAKKLYPKRKEVIAPRSVHYSIDKACDLLSLKLIKTPLDENFKADISYIKKRISRRTLAIVLTAGTSSLGVIDPIEAANDICDDIYFHVDAAFSGFVIPFLKRKKIKLSFELENLDSIAVDPHKMGLSPIPSGAIIFRDESYLERVAFEASYLPSKAKKTKTLLGSRPGGSIAAIWANIKLLGINGYQNIVEKCISNTKYLIKKLNAIDALELVIKEPEINFIAIKLSKNQKKFKNIEELQRELERRNFLASVDKETSSLRIVIMPHITKDVIDSFIAALESIFKK